MDCEYKVGRSLRFVIAGVGQDDVAITFYRVDFDSDYYASVALLHGCVVVKPSNLVLDTLVTRSARRAADSVATFAFVSPRDGKTYRDWPSCHKATKRPNER
jgi:hypothetical protein